MCMMLTLVFTSCYNTKTLCGNITDTTELRKVKQQRNSHYFWGLKPGKTAVMKAEDFVGDEHNYVIKNHQTFMNMFVNCITLGIYAPTTTTYYVTSENIK